jgi:hypothetical protein
MSNFARNWKFPMNLREHPDIAPVIFLPKRLSSRYLEADASVSTDG